MNKTLNVVGPQYLYSTGNITTDSFGKKITSYFYPSLSFPNSIEILSLTFLYNYTTHTGTTNDKIIQIVTLNDKKPTILKNQFLTHKLGNTTTTQTFPIPIYILPHQPVYFFTNEELKDTSLVITIRT